MFGALLVPANALRGSTLFVLEGDVARKRDVKVGIRGARNTQVQQGLAETDRVIAPFPDELTDGVRVLERRG